MKKSIMTGTIFSEDDTSFDPPGFPREGNDWILAIERIESARNSVAK